MCIVNWWFEEAVARVIDNATKKIGLHPDETRAEEIVEAFVSGCDLFGILPTEFEKNLYLACCLTFNLTV